MPSSKEQSGPNPKKSEDGMAEAHVEQLVEVTEE